MKKVLLSLCGFVAFAANATTGSFVKPEISGYPLAGIGQVNLSLRGDTAKKDSAAGRDLSHYVYHAPGTFLVPVILVAYGGLSFVVKPIRNVDYYFKGEAANSDPTAYSKVSDYTQLSPAVLVYALNLFGDEGQDRFVDRTALLALSGAFLTVADGTKYLAHRDRPYGTDPLSFPSGHTGAAFLCAEFLAQEYSWKSPWYGVIGYTLATATGVLRVYGGAHWFSDCVAGAGLGMLSTKAAYLVYPHIRKIFSHKDKYGRSTMLLPSYQNGAAGLAFNMPL